MHTYYICNAMLQTFKPIKIVNRADKVKKNVGPKQSYNKINMVRISLLRGPN